MKNVWNAKGIFFATILAATSTSALAQVQSSTFPAIADSEARLAYPNSNYGLASTIITDGTGSGAIRQGYLKFTVSGILGTIQSAVVRLYVQSAGQGVSIYKLSNLWEESTITWNNRPIAPLSALLETRASLPVGLVSFNVKAAVTGNGTYSFVLSQKHSDGVVYNSRQNTSNKPALIITYSSASPSPSPIPTPSQSPSPSPSPTYAWPWPAPEIAWPLPVKYSTVVPPSLTRVTGNSTTHSALSQLRQNNIVPALGGASLNGTQVSNYISGVRKWGNTTPAQLDDKFHLGSNTKAMTATLVALFVERGYLRWNSTMSEIFPEEAYLMTAGFRGITLEMLTAHYSGISSNLDGLGSSWGSDQVADRKRVFEFTAARPLTAAPGATYIYSNTNYFIAGSVLERISGKHWETLMTELLFKPLGMASCGFGIQATAGLNPPNQPWPHKMRTDGPEPAYSDNPRALGPAGTVHCSTLDHLKFARLHIDGFRGRANRILAPASFVKLHTAYPGGTYTYGGWIKTNANGEPMFTHGGSNTLNYEIVAIYPMRDKAVVSAINRGGSDANAVTKSGVITLEHSLGITWR
jgi:CubicO group peptidase (beta-lactamase class C family)